MNQPTFELVVYPSCLDCRWRDFHRMDIHDIRGMRFVTECSKVPICKLIEGQRKITAKKDV